MIDDGLKAFCSNIIKEARKGYYSDSDTYAEGYEDAVNDILNYLEDRGTE